MSTIKTQKVSKLLALTLGAALSLSAVSLPAHADVEASMKTIARNYRAAGKADTPEMLKKDLQAIKAAALQAKEQMPTKPKGITADSHAHHTYIEGLDKLLGQTDHAITLVDAGKIKDAKAILNEMKLTRDHYHKELKVKD
ncbi:MAG: cytochrome b562 [Plesiomonas sp.]|uniref:cytochrome b562 n=1 Tax=Plesiomonas sp. TaxID=2486279 RepID=UPI003F2C38DD